MGSTTRGEVFLGRMRKEAEHPMGIEHNRVFLCDLLLEHLPWLPSTMNCNL